MRVVVRPEGPAAASHKRFSGAMSREVLITSIDRAISVAEGETILEAALEQGVDYPFACHSGTCGSCKSKLLSGDIHFLDYSRFALTDEERAQGWILACSAVPVTDCEVAYNVEPGLAAPHPVRQFDARVAGLRDATHDIKIVTLEPGDGRPLAFSAGQFVQLRFGDLPERDYSMASCPGEPRLEFHIRLTPGGRISGFVHNELRPGDTVRLRGPYGSSFFRDGHAGPMLALAGGSGLAPIKSIVETALEAGFQREIRLYFGVRDERDLYLENHFKAVAAAHDNLSFIPVLSEPSGATKRRTGFLADVLRDDLRSLGGWQAYLAGPPIMVDTCVAALTDLGIDSADCHADAFYTQAERETASGGAE